jgi:quinol-cytochrome oxidoreductase complex cytochrome b subunit
MRFNQQNGFVRFVLRTIDVLISFRTMRTVRWDQDPFQKSNKGKWRSGWIFLATVPIFMVIFTTNSSIHSFIDSVTERRRSVVWFYMAFIGFVLLGVFGWIKIGPKIPLYISIPAAIVAWFYCVWLFNFHSEKLLP